MRKLVFGLVGASALALASAASAGTCGSGCSFTVTPGVNPYAGPAPTYTFDPGSQPGGGTTTSNIVTGTNGLIYAQPYGTDAGTGAYGGLGYYFAVGPGPGNTTPGYIDLTSIGDIATLSFIWGSVDQYNTLDILDNMGNTLYEIVGNDIFNPANGDRSDPNTNPLVTFTFTDPTAVGWLKLSSSQNAFEIDNLRVAGVPEPATWALMLLGFGGIGFAMRRGRKPALAQLA